MNTSNQESIVADEYAKRSWAERFSPNHEFPYSSGAAVLLHVVLLLILAFWLANPTAKDRGAVEVEVIKISSEPNPGDTVGDGSGGGGAGELIFDEAEPVESPVEIEQAEIVRNEEVTTNTQVNAKIVDSNELSPDNTNPISETSSAIDQLQVKQPVTGGGSPGNGTGIGIGDGDGDGVAGGGGGTSINDLIGALKSKNAGEGDIQFSLFWNGRNDLDMHVQTPRGVTLWYRNPNSGDGGQLDLDANAGGRFSAQPIENVFWPVGTAPEGKYRVGVVYYGQHGSPVVTPFTLLIRIKQKNGETKEIKRNGTARFVGQEQVMAEIKFKRD